MTFCWSHQHQRCVVPSSALPEHYVVLLGVPLADDKFDGPTTCIRFLGILLDTIAMEARLPQDKLERLTKMVDDWLARRTASKSDLQSLLGHLYAAAKVVPPGRTFTRRLVDHLKQAGAAEAIQLSEEALADLRWWQQYLGDWNGKSFFQEPFFTPAADLQLFTDASGTIGFGAYFNGNWLNGRWTPGQVKRDNRLEGIVCHRHCRCSLGAILPAQKNHVSLRQRNRGRRRLVRLFHRCCIDETNALSVFSFVPKAISRCSVSTYQVCITVWLMLSFVSRWTASAAWHRTRSRHQLLCRP